MNLSWMIGDVRVTRIVEMDLVGDGQLLIEAANPEAVKAIDWLAPHFADPDGNLMLSFHALVVETPSRRIIVDTCVGNDKERHVPVWHKMQTRFLDDLIGAGFEPNSIDTVLCTHLHIDHVGWNTMLVDNRWVPTFPNARYLMGRTEFDYWKAGIESAPTDMAVFADSIQPVWDAGLVDLVPSDHFICPEVRLVPTPGHTIDHVSVQITSQGETAIITGDFVHHPCQFAHPEWASRFDYDGEQSTETRRTMFETFVKDGILVIGTHFPAPTAGHVVHDANAYRLTT